MGEIAPVKLIVCLGNPGGEYASTRHNAGWKVADALLNRETRLPLPADVKPLSNGELFCIRLGQVTTLVLKPLTFMNASGEAVRSLLREFPLSPREILAVSDDLDRPFGTMRLRVSGSAGGHRGLQSIIDNLQSQDFPRLRLGIGRPEPGSGVSIVEHVLSPWVSADGTGPETVIEEAVRVIEELQCGSFERAAEMAGRFGKSADKVNAKSGENRSVQV